MLMSYPVCLQRDRNGTVIAEFPDVPQATTVGQDEANAEDWAQDALLVALGNYVELGLPLPLPSEPAAEQRTVSVPPLQAAKLAVYQAMRAQGVTQIKLAERLNCDVRQVRRILDLDHHSRIDQLDAALRVLGKRMVLDIRDLALA